MLELMVLFCYILPMVIGIYLVWVKGLGGRVGWVVYFMYLVSIVPGTNWLLVLVLLIMEEDQWNV